MKLYDKDGYEIEAKACKEPKYTFGYGDRTWDFGYKIVIDGEEIPIAIDTTWGINVHFNYNGKHYKINFVEEGLEPKMMSSHPSIFGFDFYTKEGYEEYLNKKDRDKRFTQRSRGRGRGWWGQPSRHAIARRKI